uniref:Uncharacterized protein n=1 Tax=Anopheles atroparvus TaxID=41427 RepID=A0AAG5DDX4_ANOAO
MPPPPPSMLHSMQQLYHPMAYRNELYDRTAGYDVPRGRMAPASSAAAAAAAAVPAPNYYQNQPLQPGPSGNRYANLHLELNRPPRYPSATLNPQQQQQRTPRQRSFDDTESAYQYYRYQNHPNGAAKYDNLYERVREEPAYQNTGSFAPAAANRSGLFGRFDVIGHGVGRIERHLSSSCGNIDHYSLGGHYAVMGHSHLGTMGHIRLSQSNGTAGGAGGAGNTYSTSAPNQPMHQPAAKDSSSAVNVKSFFSCLGGENSQSMNNLNKPVTSGSMNGSANGTVPTVAIGNGVGEGGGSVGGQGSSIVGGLASAAAVGPVGVSNGAIAKSTGTIPKISRKRKQSQQQQQQHEPMAGPSTAPVCPVGSLAPSGDLTTGELGPSGSRVTKPSLQWLLVNKWLPLWVGQTPPDYKFIDFNFMFSRNCDGCSAAGGSHAQQELVRYGTLEQADYIPPAREYPTMTGSYPRVLRNTPQLARLREHEYENVPLNDPPIAGPSSSSSSSIAGRSASLRINPSLASARPRSESPGGRAAGSLRRSDAEKHTGRAEGADPFRTWAFNLENNSFRPARGTLPVAGIGGSSTPPGGFGKTRDVRRITDGTFAVRDLQPDGEKAGPSGLQFAAARSDLSGEPPLKPSDPSSPGELDKDDGRLSSASTSSDSDNFAMESLAAESGDGHTVAMEAEEDSSRSGDFRPESDSPEEGAVGGESKGKEVEHGSSASNDSLESLTYEPEPEVADRSISEDEVEVALGLPGVGGEERPQAERGEKLSE